jgi:predicted TIM-barrel fold metal-dependent hydrolase
LTAGEFTLVDHHCHGVVTGELDSAAFELLITESSDPAPAGTTFFDSQLGLALRRWCPPVLGLDAHAEPGEYLARRTQLGAAEVAARFLHAAGVTDFLVDTGYQPDTSGGLTSPAELASAAGARAHPVVRLEQVAEELAAEGTSAAGFVTRYPAALAGAAAGAVAVKSIAAYRHGLDFEPSRPGNPEVRREAGGWLRRAAETGSYRLQSPRLLRFLLWSAIDLGRPVQIHTGYGDRDLTLHRCNPLLLTGFIRATQDAGVPLLLLHCYPYHREAGYLAQVYPHVYCDVGLALNFTGARAAAVLAESLELTPFGKTMYSSDAFGLPELHFLGAVIFRHALRQALGAWRRDEMITSADADRITHLIAAANARRVYHL